MKSKLMIFGAILAAMMFIASPVMAITVSGTATMSDDIVCSYILAFTGTASAVASNNIPEKVTDDQAGSGAAVTANAAVTYASATAMSDSRTLITGGDPNTSVGVDVAGPGYAKAVASYAGGADTGSFLSDPDHIFHFTFDVTAAASDGTGTATLAVGVFWYDYFGTTGGSGPLDITSATATGTYGPYTVDYRIGGLAGTDAWMMDVDLATLAAAGGSDSIDVAFAYNNPPLGMATVISAYSIIETVPIPAAIWLLGSGLMGLIAFRRNRK